jgi:asparagine synthase (glutamine-hydrolysing)
VARGHRCYTDSDTEVVIHAYEEWGDDCVLHLNGIFGLAIWDARRHRLFLARDPFGVKPLYYYCADDGRLIWSSEIKGILADPSVPRRVDPQGLDLFLTFRFVPSPRTMLQGILKLAPGHRLIRENGGHRVERYWKRPPTALARISESDAVALLQERLEAAVRRQMVSDVPVGALLSGGIDGSTVVAIMREYSSGPVRTFTVGFEGSGDVNELGDARVTAAYLGTEHHDITLSCDDYRELFERTIWHLEEPISTTSAFALQAVCQLARQHVKVVLTGQGADEPMAGYHRYYGERYGGWYRSIPAVLREGVIRPVVELLPRQERIKRAVRSLGTDAVGQRFARVYAGFAEEAKASLWRRDRRPAPDEDPAIGTIEYWRRDVEDLDALAQMAYVDARLSLADDLMMCADKMSMCCLSHATSGYSPAMAATRSSQYGMLTAMPFDLVAAVSFLRGRLLASSNAYFRMRSTPWRVNTASCSTNSRSVPSNILPPTEVYSPSVFSRTT